jgi:hypothetical protein
MPTNSTSTSRLPVDCNGRQRRFSSHKSAKIIDAVLPIDFAASGQPHDRNTVIATTPLTDEAWVICEPGDLLMFSDGSLRRRAFVPVPQHVIAAASCAA